MAGPPSPWAKARRITYLLIIIINCTDARKQQSESELSDASLLAEVPRDWQAQMEMLWQQHRSEVSYCVGAQLTTARDLLERSFPFPLETDPADPTCTSNAIKPHLCGREELLVYLKFLLFTDDTKKVPSNKWCDVDDAAPACAPGFFQTLDPSASTPPAPVALKPHACCPGYFCPAMLTCMIPCPFGAYCPRAWAADPPSSYLQNTSEPALGQTDKWCAPYSYKMRKSLGCGGAHKWTIYPEPAFPLQSWPAGSGNVYCDGRSYCPDPVTRLPCEQGHFCKNGSSQMTACPALASCPSSTETPQDNYLGFVLDCCLFALLAVFWNMTRLYHRILNHLSDQESLRIKWQQNGIKVTVVEVAETKQPPALMQWHSIDSEHVPLLPQGSTGLHQQHSNSSVEITPDTTVHVGPYPRHAGRLYTVFQAGHPAKASATAADAGSNDLDTLGRDQLLTSAVDPHLNDRAYSSHVTSSITGCRKPLLEVAFENLSMRLKSCGKLVLQDCFGQLRPRRSAAIMGPSGAGKTTLLAALTGKAAYGIVTGTITIGGRLNHCEYHKQLTGFVAQDDIMYRTLTVEENLLYSACFRLPAATSRSQRMEVVDHAINMLGLGDVRSLIIGDEEVRGISGGQRKRVNVGIELVADPSILYLDEPTSGLDSTASRGVVKGLKFVADSGVTVAAVIHQPSYETFCLFDDLLLLAKGGVLVYCGPQASVQRYFEGLGFQIPEHTNPADAFLDIISGTIKPRTGEKVDLPAAWKRHTSATSDAAEGGAAALTLHTGNWSTDITQPRGKTLEDDDALPGILSLQRPKNLLQYVQQLLLWGLTLSAAAAQDTFSTVYETIGTLYETTSSFTRAAADQLHSWAVAIATPSSSGSRSSIIMRMRSAYLRRWRATSNMAGISSKSQPSFVHQYYWCLSRAILLRSREPMMVFIDYTIFAITGSFLGLMSDRGRGSVSDYVGSIMHTIVAVGLMAMVSGIRTFGGPDRLVYHREASAGLNRLAHFSALDTWANVGMVLRCAVYLAMYYSFSQPRAVIWQLYLITCAIYYSCTGMAYVLSQLMSPTAAQLTAAVAAVLNAVVASKFQADGFLGMIQKVGYARWGLEGYVIAEANRLTGVWLLARCADLKHMHYNINHFWQCFGVLVCIGVVSRATACLGLLVLHREKTL